MQAGTRAAVVLALLVLSYFLAPAKSEADPGELFDDTVVRTFDLRFHAPDWPAVLDRLADDAYARADLVADGATLADVGVRYKGNSSSRIAADKKPFNVTLDAFVDGQRLMGYDTVNLNNGFVDPTLVREAVTYRSLRPFVPTPGATFVRLLVNGEYFGLYVLVQQIERTYLDEWFGSDDDGFLFKGDPPDAVGAPMPDVAVGAAPHQPRPPGGLRPDLRWLGEDLSAYRRTYDLKTVEAGDAAYEALRELTRALDAPVAEGGVTDDGFAAEIERHLDVDGALWYIAAHNLFANFDSYYSGHNYYLYRAQADERFHVLSWDMNESFGVFRAPGVDPADARTVIEADPFLQATAADRPLLRRLLSVPTYRADYLAHYRTLLAEAFAGADLEASVAAYQGLIREDVRTDPNLLYGLDLFARNVWQDVRVRPDGGSSSGPGTRAVPGLLRVASERSVWLAARADLAPPDHALATHLRMPGAPTRLESPTVTLGFSGSDAPVAVTLHVRRNGAAAVAQDMQPQGGGRTWSAAIPAARVGTLVTYFARVAFADGRTAFHPPANHLAPWAYTVRSPDLPVTETGDLVLNELQADNQSTIADPEGEFDDWIELANRGVEPIRLAGHYLSDDEADPHAYALPDVWLDPGSHYLVWCDNDPEQGPDHADFRLSLDGETVVLATDDAIVDRVVFGPQLPDQSYGRRSDGADAWGICTRPSPRGPNECAGAGFTPTAQTPTTPAASSTPSPTASPTSAPLEARVFLPFAALP